MEKISSFIPSTFDLVENYTVQVQQTRGETLFLFPRKDGERLSRSDLRFSAEFNYVGSGERFIIPIL